jgi:hypothetical protein
MKYRFLFALFFAFNTQASPPIEATKLDDLLAAELGFSINKTQDKFGLTIELKGPKIFGDSCKPLAAGHFIVKDDKEVSAFINSAHPKEPESISFIAEPNKANLIVFIDYQCNGEAKRFIVSSNE